jgi:hypothetical protein
VQVLFEDGEGNMLVGYGERGVICTEPDEQKGGAGSIFANFGEDLWSRKRERVV